MKKNQNKVIAFIALSVLALVGTYNAVMINADSSVADGASKNFKRLDEVYGVVKVGRKLAVHSNWSKIEQVKVAPKVIVLNKEVSKSVVAQEAVIAPAAIQESLELKLVEVINPKKWQNGVKADQFNGALSTNAGSIDSLTAALPENMQIEISFSELTGNVFEYDLNGEVYSGMMYQVDQNAYMVTLTNGPLEGTQMKFAGEAVTAEQSQNYLAETHNVEVGSFGEEIQAPVQNEAAPAAAAQADTAGFNFNI